MEAFALSGVIGALSFALDLTEGQPPGHALRSCMIGMRIAEELELPAADRSDLFYALLLKDAGCSVNASRMAALFGADDQELKRTAKQVDWTSRRRAAAWAAREAGAGGKLGDRVGALKRVQAAGEVARELAATRCDRGAEIARKLFLTEATAGAIRGLDEHWDGSGHPDGLQGAEIPLFARILCLAQTVEVFHAAGGVGAAREVALRRRARWFDPVIVDAFAVVCRDAAFWRSLEAPDVTVWEPEELVLAADEERLDAICEGFARVIDAKSPYTARHSERVSELAVGIGEMLGYGPATLRGLRRAALLHDIGKLAISSRILDKPGKLTDDEFAAIRSHPVYSLQILERARCFASIAELAANHHERLDGRGYPRRLGADRLDQPMRALAVADVYEALTAERPYRTGMPRERALEIVHQDVPERLDPDVAAALEAHLDRPRWVATVGVDGSEADTTGQRRNRSRSRAG